MARARAGRSRAGRGTPRAVRSGPVIIALAVAAVAGLAACSAAAGASAGTRLAGGFGTLPAQAGRAASGKPGPVSLAEPPGAAPNWILPVVPSAADSVSTVQGFGYQMWRPLYWEVRGVSPAIDPAMSLARPPVWSNGGRTVTVTMNPAYRWSDGQPVSSRDVAFAIDLIRAAVRERPANWIYYTRGFLPDDIARLRTPDRSTLVLTLKAPVNPGWFRDNELAVLQPMPAHAWARAAAGGPLLDYASPASARRIYDFLASQSRARAGWAANPLWRVVDGPFRLASFSDTTGAYTMTANRGYRGPESGRITGLRAVPFASDAAEFSALLAGRVDAGYVPPADLTRIPAVRARGYHVFGYPAFGWTYAGYNFRDKTGGFAGIARQLYFRQAMAHLEDQAGYIAAFMHGAGGQDYGPVPSIPVSQYAPGNATANPYPFSLAAARKNLTSHGWRVMPGGVSTCARPGTGAGQCGAGIPGGTRLAFNLVYSTNPPLLGQELTDLAAKAAQVGIRITLQGSSFRAIITSDNNAAAPGNQNKWAMSAFGGFTPSLYPTTYSVFNTRGGDNLGSYSDPEADRLIRASISSADPDAVRAEAAYLTAQQPGLFLPNPDVVVAWKRTLSGPPDSFANMTQYYSTPELWYRTR